MKTKSDHRAIIITSEGQATLQAQEPNTTVLGSTEICGKTLVTLISPGTEMAVYFGKADWAKFPFNPGYAAVFQVEETGVDVQNIAVGDLVFCKGPHRSWQHRDEKDVVRLPDGLSPDVAVFARLMGVSMTTLVTTRARPPSTVLVTGLGLVGNLAAQMFSSCGYRVIAVDPLQTRRELAMHVGQKEVYATIPVDDPALRGAISLAVECSGHEDAVIDSCKTVRKGGEVALVGVPWSQRSESMAFDLLHLVFHNYIHLRSGWEWELPDYRTEFSEGSIQSNYEGALRWLVDGRINVEALAKKQRPTDPQTIYNSILNKSIEGLSILIDWQ